jgi:hypothetical protein
MILPLKPANPTRWPRLAALDLLRPHVGLERHILHLILRPERSAGSDSYQHDENAPLKVPRHCLISARTRASRTSWGTMVI